MTVRKLRFVKTDFLMSLETAVKLGCENLVSLLKIRVSV